MWTAERHQDLSSPLMTEFDRSATRSVTVASLAPLVLFLRHSAIAVDGPESECADEDCPVFVQRSSRLRRLAGTLPAFRMDPKGSLTLITHSI